MIFNKKRPKSLFRNKLQISRMKVEVDVSTPFVLSLSLSLIELFTLSLLSHIVRHDLTHLISFSYFPLFSIWSCLTWRREYNISVMALGQFSLPPPLPMLASRPPPHLQDFQLFKKCFKKLGQPRPLFCCFSLFFQTQISQKITVGFSAIRTWIVGVEGKAHWPLDHHHGPLKRTFPAQILMQKALNCDLC